MANETTAIVEVTLNLDPDKMNQLEADGCSDYTIEQYIKKSVTVKIDSKCPVCDIGEVILRKYY